MTASLPISLAAGKIQLVYDDYLCLPDDGMRYEILEGALIMTPTPVTRHQRISRNILFKLMESLVLSGEGEVFAAPYDVVLSKHNVVQPDLIYVSAENAHLIGEKHFQGAPDLIVEILSPSTRRRDVLTKSEIYARHAVHHYWIVDPDVDRIETFELTDHVYQSAGTWSLPQTMRPQAFPGLVLPLSFIFGP